MQIVYKYIIKGLVGNFISFNRFKWIISWRTILKTKGSKTTRWVDTTLRTLGFWYLNQRDNDKPVRDYTETGVGPLLDGVASQGLQVRHLCRNQDPEVSPPLHGRSVLILKGDYTNWVWELVFKGSMKWRFCRKWPNTSRTRSGFSL